ncbi:MAG TPA: hypothetical protein V6C57_12745 [Coleofasciculaceae cyanobacterium]
MISLKNSWQQQRQQRQQALSQRQQQVRQTLDRFQQERQEKAIALRKSLYDFQGRLQQETQALLLQAHLQRQEQAMQLAQQLCHFTQQLRQQTAELLSMHTADRVLMTQQLFQELGEFQASLTTSVKLLRQNLQTQIQALRAETQDMLQAHRQTRIRNQMQTMQELATFIEVLQSEVESYLTELGQARQAQAKHMQQQLQESRECRLAETATLFQQLTEFRADLRSFCAELRQSVWGEAIGLEKPSVPASAPASAPAGVTALNLGKSETSSRPQAVAIAPAADRSPVAADPMPIEKQIYQHLYQTQGARLTEIETALKINRFQAVDALRLLIKQGLVIQRDRVYLIQEEVRL